MTAYKVGSSDEDLTATENLWLFGKLQGLRSADARAAAKRLLGQFGLEEAAKGYAEFDKGIAAKFVLDPHGLLPRAV